MRAFPLNLLFTWIFTLVIVGVLSADVPHVVNYQGRLADVAGQPIADGPVNLTFRLYDAATEGNLLWSEDHPAVSISGGLFSVLLGSELPFSDSIVSDPDRWLEVSVNGEAISPRTRLATTGYSYRVGTVDGASGGELSGGLVLVNPNVLPLKEGQTLADASRIILAFNGDGIGSIALYDPVDSKSGTDVATKRVEIVKDGIVMFGETESDTNLFVGPNGDIIGRGQITMGENSSPGVETSVLGFQNIANGDSSTIGGGSSNITYGALSVIAGGHENVAGGEGSVISGGRHNTADGMYGMVAGGENNSATGPHAVVSGGIENSAAGAFATVPGGELNAAEAVHSYAAGRRAKALHDGSFVWADHADEDFASTGPDQFIVRAKGGVGIGTDSPTGVLEVAGEPGDTTVTLPTDAIASREIWDEPGLAGTVSGEPVSLQLGQGMQELASVTITTPAAGYIFLQGTATLEAYGTTGPNQAYLQIDDETGGVPEAPYYALAGSGDHDSPGRSHYFSMHVQRTYLMEAGTHVFFLEAQYHPTKTAEGAANILNPALSATYFPTSYGTVSATSIP